MLTGRCFCGRVHPASSAASVAYVARHFGVGANPSQRSSEFASVCSTRTQAVARSVTCGSARRLRGMRSSMTFLVHSEASRSCNLGAPEVLSTAGLQWARAWQWSRSNTFNWLCR
jgi:hypothetical protein